MYLEKHQGDYISGVKLAEYLGLSRNAIWKAIKQLEKEGFEIEAKRNLGYCLSKTKDRISIAGLLPFLEKTAGAVRLEYFDTIDSTNRYAKELAINGELSKKIVIANEQTAGRGRYGKTFESPENTGLYFSLILKKEDFNFSTPTLITMYIAVKIVQVIKKLTGKELTIKWVNDLFYQDKKVCGILTEAVTNFESGEIDWIVVGVGFNFSTPKEAFSQEVAQTAQGLFSTEERMISRNELLGNLIESLILDLKTVDERQLLADYRSHLLGLNEWVTILQGKTTYPALVLGIDQEGQLQIKKEDGRELFLNTGEVRLKL